MSKDRAPATRTISRDTARVIPVRPDGKILMMYGFEPARPDWKFWFTIGGGLEPGETHVEAAVRELREEVGIVVTAAELGEPVLDDQIEFDWGETHIVQQQRFYVLRLSADLVPDLSGLDASEIDTIEKSGWVDPADLESGVAEVPDPAIIRYVREALAALEN